MFTVETKRSQPLALSGGLALCIREVHHMEPEIFADVLHRLDSLRQEVIVMSASVEAVHRLSFYYGQISRIRARYPLPHSESELTASTGQATLKYSFVWYPSGTFSSGGLGKSALASVTSHSVLFEEAAILFNIGAMLSILASRESRSSMDGLKSACSYYIGAATAFLQIRSQYSSVIPAEASDLGQTQMECLVDSMLAYAQECCYLKAQLGGTTKEGLLARLAQGCANLFAAAARSSSQPLSRAASKKSGFLGIGGGYSEVLSVPGFSASLQALSVLYQAKASHHKALDLASVDSIGAAIRQLQDGISVVEASRTCIDACGDFSLVKDVDTISAEMVTLLASHRKDNDLIFHQVVPSASDPINPAVLANRPENSSVFDSSAGQALGLSSQVNAPFFFEMLSPLQDRVALSSIEHQRQQIIYNEGRSLIELEGRMEELLSHSALSTFLYMDSGNSAAPTPDLEHVPGSVLNKAHDVRRRGGYAAMEQLVEDRNRLSSECDVLLKSCKNMLDQEAMEDAQARKVFGSKKWTRAPSEKLNKLMIARLKECSDHFKKASALDEKADSEFDLHTPVIVSLSTDEGNIRNELAELIPASVASSPIQALDAEERLLDETRQAVCVQSDYRQIIESAIENIENKALSVDCAALLASGQMTEEDIVGQIRTAVMSDTSDRNKLKADLQEYMRGVERLVSEISERLQARHEQQKAAEQRSSALKKADQARNKVLDSIATAYQAFCQIMPQLVNARTLYSDLKNKLVSLEDMVSSYVSGRAAELATLQQSLQGMGSSGGHFSASFGGSSSNISQSSGTSNHAHYGFSTNSTGHQQPQGGGGGAYYQQPSPDYHHPPQGGYPQPQQQQQQQPWNPSMPVNYAPDNYQQQQYQPPSYPGNNNNNSGPSSPSMFPGAHRN